MSHPNDPIKLTRSTFERSIMGGTGTRAMLPQHNVTVHWASAMCFIPGRGALDPADYPFVDMAGVRFKLLQIRK